MFALLAFCTMMFFKAVQILDCRFRHGAPQAGVHLVVAARQRVLRAMRHCQLLLLWSCSFKGLPPTGGPLLLLWFAI